MRALLISALLAALAAAQAPPRSGADFFESRVRPLLVSRCGACHGEKVQMGGKQLTTRDGFHRSGAVVAGDPDSSPLVRALRHDGAVKMPPTGKLAAAEIEVFVQWIRGGAIWPETVSGDAGVSKGLWSLEPVRKPEPPAVANAAWARSAVDRFILARLEAARIEPAPEASRHTLLRRVTLDLTGLLPTPDEIDGFVNDSQPDAFERAVDRLLASPAFGERWGRHWLDVTYYADTTGVGRRIPLPEAWRYRDYVIRAFQTDKPYDAFLREQISGPAMKKGKNGEEPDEDARAATGFLVLGPWAWFAYDKAQMRLDVADLQVDLIGRTVLGLTLGCARCHDHKFDPITNKDYYGLAGIFLSTKTTSRSNGEGGINLVRLPESVPAAKEYAAALEAWEKRVAETEAATKVHEKDQKAVREEIEALRKKPASEETAAAIKAAEARLAELKKKTEFAPDRQILAFTKYNKPRWPQVYAAEEMEFPENARIAARGDAHQLGAFVERGAPQSILRSETVDPHSSGRKELAAWLTDPKHPLTARVWVNRLWHHLFGTGIVASTDNFGNRGEAPTHPELLDYLATRLVESKWSTKTVIREIVLSRVYQLSSRPEGRGQELDPDNRLLWRSSRRRLEVEAIRDTLLQVSGGLDRAAGGPSLPLTAQNVHTIAPYFLEDDSLVEPHVKRRRTVYQPVMRNSQMADVDILNVFDSKDPDQVVGARPATTVPSQMLYLMNSPFVKEESRRLAASVLASGGDADARVGRIVLAALNRPATERDFSQARQFLSDFRAGVAKDKSAAETDLEAWARYCHAIFASSEFLYRR